MTATSFSTLQQSWGETGSLEYTPKFTVVSQHFWQEFCVPCFWHSPQGSSFGTIWSGNWAGQVMSQKWKWVCLETLSWELVWQCVLHEQWLKTSCAWWQSVWMLCQVGKLFQIFQISDTVRCFSYTWPTSLPDLTVPKSYGKRKLHKMYPANADALKTVNSEQYSRDQYASVVTC